jgi:hypothetical protein
MATFHGALTNAGTMLFDGGGMGMPGSSGTFTAPVTSSGTIHVVGGASAMFGASVSNTGTLTVDFSAHADFGGAASYSGSGTITNNGIVTFSDGFTSPHGASGTGMSIFSSGPVASGTGSDSTAVLSFGGDVSLSASTTLSIRIAGTTRGSGYDALAVVGNLNLAGALSVGLVGFAPTAGNSFDILDWGSLGGTFSSLSLPPLTTGLMWNSSKLYTTGVLSVQMLGDYNGNGVVDAADYTVWRDTLGQMGTGLAADGNGNGTIDAGDYTVWQTNFGNHAGSGATSSLAVPEPTGLLLAWIGALAMQNFVADRRQNS